MTPGDDASAADDPDTGAALAGHPAFQLSQARSRSGAIAVVTSPQGLPMSVRIDATQLGKAPEVLAAEILGLCKQSALAAGVRLREHMLASGASREAVDAMKLPRPDDLARAEQDDDADIPDSWLRPV